LHLPPALRRPSSPIPPLFLSHEPSPPLLYSLSLHDALPISCRCPASSPATPATTCPWAAVTTCRPPSATTGRKVRSTRRPYCTPAWPWRSSETAVLPT